AEQNYIRQIRIAAMATYAPSIHAPLRNALSGIMNHRLANTYYPSEFNRRTTFTFANEAESQNVFETMMAGYGNFQGYETILDNWLQRNAIAPIGQSKERLALISLTFNNANKLLGPKLAAGLRNNDRAEAWYEIRYNSNRDVVNAKRRFYEAD